MLLRHPVLAALTFVYLAVVGWVTLGPQPLDGDGRRMLWTVIRWLQRHEATSWVTYSGVEFAANVLMFVPVGLLFVLLLGRRLWWLGVLLGVALTIGIETAQLFIQGRVPDLRDIAANSLGGLAGVLIALLVTWPRLRAGRSGTARQKRFR